MPRHGGLSTMGRGVILSEKGYFAVSICDDKVDLVRRRVDYCDINIVVASDFSEGVDGCLKS